MKTRILQRATFTFALAIAASGLAHAQAVPLDQAISQSARAIDEALPVGTRVAVVNCESPTVKMSAYVVGEITVALAKTKRLVLVEREDLDLVEAELDFQLSGAVSDESAQSIGKMLGAEVIVTLSARDGRLRAKAIEVESARIAAVSSVEFARDARLDTLSETLVLVLDFAAPSASLASTAGEIALSAVSGAPGFRAVSGKARERALGSDGVSANSISDRRTRARLARETKADALLVGKVSREGGLWYLSISLVDMADGTVRSSSTESFRTEGVLVEAVAGQTLAALGLGAEVSGTVRVTNVTEFLRAIGPDRVIRLAAGTYDLTDGYRVKNRHVSWVDEYDGPCPVVKSVSNLSIVGEPGAVIVIKPAYGWVLSFETCSQIRISGLVVGHTTPGYCLGGVLRFKNCEDVEIRDSELYGSGTHGLGLTRASRFLIEGCVVRDCTYGLAVIEDSSDLSFLDTEFRGTGEYDLISITSSTHLSWEECRFVDNHGNILFSIDGASQDVVVSRCAFETNEIEDFSNRVSSPSVRDCSFSHNSFAVPESE